METCSGHFPQYAVCCELDGGFRLDNTLKLGTSTLALGAVSAIRD